MPEAQRQRLRRLPPEPIGVVTLAGEIIDSKCYLGAMKPGGRKTHKGCAILCLSGGVPPMLVTRAGGSREQFYLLVGPDGGPIAHDVLDFVGDPVELTGAVERQGDLQVLRVAPNGIRRR
jgi:hypothetical protein